MSEEDEIELLVNRAEKRLEASHYLLKEGFYEDAVSRAYYCMYFAAKALLLKKDITIKTHRGLISRFGLEFVNEGIIEDYYGKALRIAEEIREEADYSITRTIDMEEAESVIEDAEKFLERIRRALEEL
ncbi:MAG: HEPN domain-containing protein [Archaeoglobaceae archaeon]